MMTIETIPPSHRRSTGPASRAPHRCAIYFAPPVLSEWWMAGSQWLGRCARTGMSQPQPRIPGVEPGRFHALTADPRRYGWHATLKAPFELAPGCGLDDLRAALRALCADHSRFTLPPVVAQRMDRFIALRPAQPSAALDALAADCVRRLHLLAAPLTEAELARRRRVPLTPHQDALLLQWGYPWVLDHFRFHLSLTGDIDGEAAATQAALQEAAQAWFGALPPCEVGHLSLFVEPVRGAEFMLVEQLELGA